MIAYDHTLMQKAKEVKANEKMQSERTLPKSKR